jgi:MFS family permease
LLPDWDEGIGRPGAVQGSGTPTRPVATVAWEGRRELAIVACIFFAQLVVIVTIPVAAARDGLSSAVAGVVLGVYGGTSLLADVPAAALSDALGRRVLMVLGGLVLAVGSLTLALLLGLPGYVLGAVLVAAGFALLVSPSLAHLSELGDPLDQVSLQGANGAVQAAASIAAVLMVGGLLATIGPAAAFVLAIGAGLAIALLALGTHDHPRQYVNVDRWLAVRSFASGFALLRERLVLLATLLAVAYGLIFLVVGNAFTAPFAIALGVSPAVVGVLLALRTVVILLVSPTFGAVARRYGVATPAVVTTAIGAAGAVLVAVAPSTLWVLVPAMALQGLALAYSAAAANVWIATATASSSRAVGIATSNLGSRTALLVAAPVLGAAQIVQAASPFIVGGALVLLVAFAMYRLSARQGSGNPSPSEELS